MKQRGQIKRPVFAAYLENWLNWFIAFVHKGLIPLQNDMSQGRDSTLVQLAQEEEITHYKYIWQRFPNEKKCTQGMDPTTQEDMARKRFHISIGGRESTGGRNHT